MIISSMSELLSDSRKAKSVALSAVNDTIFFYSTMLKTIFIIYANGKVCTAVYKHSAKVPYCTTALEYIKIRVHTRTHTQLELLEVKNRFLEWSCLYPLNSFFLIVSICNRNGTFYSMVRL